MGWWGTGMVRYGRAGHRKRNPCFCYQAIPHLTGVGDVIVNSQHPTPYILLHTTYLSFTTPNTHILTYITNIHQPLI